WLRPPHALRETGCDGAHCPPRSPAFWRCCVCCHGSAHGFRRCS
ncbi:MAG: hypothetical protein AVDCRST_MAG26-263, partial [uncultured Chloroflexia bacterium]